MVDHTGQSSYSYDALGRLTLVTQGSGRAVSYTYTPDGQVAQMGYPDGTMVTYGYDPDGNLVTVTDPSGTATYTYDDMDRVASLTRPNGTQTVYTYDDRSMVTSVVDQTTGGDLISSYSYIYTSTGLIGTETQQWTDPATGGVLQVVRTFTYDQDHRLTGYTETEPSPVALTPVTGSPGSGTQTVTYAFDPVGNRIGATRTLPGNVTMEEITYTYDQDDQLVRADSTLTGVTTYTYTPDGLLESASNTDTGVVSYEWTASQRLQAVREGGILLMAVTYDGDHNKVFQVEARPVAASSIYVRTGGSVFTWTDDDLLETPGGVFWYGFAHTVAQQTTGLNGVLTPLVLRDVRDGYAATRIKISDDTGLNQTDVDALQQAGVTPEDIQDLVTSIEVNVVLPTSTARIHGYDWDITHYVNDVNTTYTQVIAEYGPSGVLTADYTYGVDRLNIRATGLSPTTTWLTDQTPSTGWYHTDGRGSVTSVSNSTGIVVQAMSYDPWGMPSFATGRTSSSLFGWNQEEYSPTTGLQYLRARWYEPTHATFISADTVLGDITQPASLNLYTYANGDPVNWIDPSGHSIIDKAVGVVAKAATTVAKAVQPAAKVIATATSAAKTTAKSTVSWVANKVVAPTAVKVSNAVSKVNQTIRTVSKTVSAATTTIASKYRATTNYATHRLAEIRQRVIEFACGSAQKLATGAAALTTNTTPSSLTPGTSGIACMGCIPLSPFAPTMPFTWLDVLRTLLTTTLRAPVPVPVKIVAGILLLGGLIYVYFAKREVFDEVIEEAKDRFEEFTDKHGRPIHPDTKNQPEPGGSSGNKPPRPPILLPAGGDDPNDKPSWDPSEWPTQKNGNCEQVAKEIQKLIGGQIKRITAKSALEKVPFPKGYSEDALWYFHDVVIKDGMVYDGITGPSGMSIAEYKGLFDGYIDAILWGF